MIAWFFGKWAVTPLPPPGWGGGRCAMVRPPPPAQLARCPQRWSQTIQKTRPQVPPTPGRETGPGPRRASSIMQAVFSSFRSLASTRDSPRLSPGPLDIARGPAGKPRGGSRTPQTGCLRDHHPGVRRPKHPPPAPGGPTYGGFTPGRLSPHMVGPFRNGPSLHPESAVGFWVEGRSCVPFHPKTQRIHFPTQRAGGK